MALRMPTIFISHGAPNLELARPPVAQFLAGLTRKIPRPDAILCVSAHWETGQPTVSAVKQPEVIYDFFGFQEKLYSLTYPAPGSPELANNVVDVLAANNVTAQIDHTRGLDHGAWVPLRLMYPEADIPVVQLSVQSGLDPVHHMGLGQKLSPLRDQRVLIMGSGGATHNLGEFHNYPIDAKPASEATAFDIWLEQCITHGNDAALLQYKKHGPHAHWNHPSNEHFLPLFVALGAAEADSGQPLHKSFTYGVLSMAAYAWGL